MLDKLLSDVRENAITHGSIPFWSWNDKLEEKELRHQIRNMHDLGMNGFFMHARCGLETEYMSEEWYDAIRVCIDEAKKLGMEAWAYDENGWPSGFAGGKLLEDKANLAHFLTYKVETEFPADALAVYVLENGKARRVTSPEAGKEYHVLRVGTDTSYVDILDKRVIAKFIRSTYEEYKKKIAPEDFGKTMPGFFTDEPQYFRAATPWSNILEDEFRKAFGYEILDNALALFVDCADYKTLRYDYHRLITDLYLESFPKQIYEWCEANGCKLTGHTIDENTITGQLMCCGSAMRFYEYEHIPGIDWLGRWLKWDSMPKQIGSVCAQLGKKRSITETFACCGWDVSPRELKNIADFQYVNGINTMCEHLYPYSIRGQRKRDYPAHYSEYLPWQKHLLDFDTYYNNLGYLLSGGEESVRTLVIHPIMNAFMYYARENTKNMAGENARLSDLSALLSQNQIAHHYGDEELMKKYAKVVGDKLIVGNCTYDRVILPDVETITASTASLLREYLAGGGKLTLMGKAPTLIDARPADLSFLHGNFDFDDLRSAEEVRFIVGGNRAPSLRAQIRRTAEGRRIFVTNVTKDTVGTVKIVVKNCRGLAKLDLITLDASPVLGERIGEDFRMLCHIGDSESFMLVETDDIAPLPMFDFRAPSGDVLLPPKVARLVGSPRNALTLDTLDYALGDGEFVRDIPLDRLRDELLQMRYRGELTIRHRFTVDEIPVSLSLAGEPLSYKSLTVNGKPVSLSGAPLPGTCFGTADILPLLRVGENEVTYKIDYFQRDYVYYVLYGGVSESLRNCLNFDTEIETMYLFGDFRLKTDRDAFVSVGEVAETYSGKFAIASPRPEVETTDIVRDGFPFFAGELTYSYTLHHEAGKPTVLRLSGRYSVAEVAVNGKKAAKFLFNDTADLAPYLREGDNEITVTLWNANRNLMGPLHHSQVEVWSLSPSTFTGEKKWKNGAWVDFLPDRYCFVRFGVDAE